LIAAINKVDDVAWVSQEGDVSHGKQALATVEVSDDRERTVKECRVCVDNRDVDGIRVTAVERPSDIVRGTLDPVSTGARSINGDRQCGGGKAEESKSVEEHDRL